MTPFLVHGGDDAGELHGTQLDLERDLQREAGQTDDYREGVAAFLAKRAPSYTGH